MEWLYKALEQYAYITVRSIIFKFIALLSMFMFVRHEGDYQIYGAVSILAASASNIFNFIHVHKYISMKPVGNYNYRQHLKAVAVFFAMACATTIYTHLDTVMLGFMKTDDDVGYYNAAVKIKVILVSIVTSLGTVLLPRVSYYIQQGKTEEFRKITRKALNFVMLIATPLTVYFIMFAKAGILFLSGKNFYDSIVPMQLIMPTLILIGLSNITGIQVLVPLGKEKVVLYSEIAGAVVDLALNAILIPFMASSGAAIGTLVAEFVVLAYQYNALKDQLSEDLKKIHYFKILAAIAAGSLGSVWVLWLGLGSFLTLLISSVIFFGLYGVTLLILKEKLVNEIFEQVIGKIKKRF